MNLKFSTEKAQNILMQMLYHELTQPIVYKTPFSINNILIMDENLYEELIQYLETLTYQNGLDDKQKTHIRKISTQHFVKNHTLYRRSKAGNIRVITLDLGPETSARISKVLGFRIYESKPFPKS